jgi:hypothetical protein
MSSLEEIERRLAMAERTARASRIVSSIALLACVGAFVLPQRPVAHAQGTPLSSTVQAPFLVVDKSGQPILRVDDPGVTLRGALRLRDGSGAESASIANGVLNLGDEKKGGLTAGLGGSGNGYVLVRTVTGQDGIGLGPYLNQPMGVYVLGPDGRTPQASLQINDKQKGALFLGAPNEGGLSAGVGASGVGFALFRGNAASQILRIGSYQGGPFAISVLGADGQTPQATLGLDDAQKGSLRVGDPRGVRGVLGATKSGGVSFALYDGAGSDYRVGLLAAPDMSFVRLNKAKNAIHLNVDGNDGGAIHVFNALGNAAASLVSTSSGYGKLSLGNVSGDTMVEAGTTTDQLGIVRAGPTIGGPATNNLTGLPFAIVGKKARGGGPD